VLGDFTCVLEYFGDAPDQGLWTIPGSAGDYQILGVPSYFCDVLAYNHGLSSSTDGRDLHKGSGRLGS
jgi:hypothetical protein